MPLNFIPSATPQAYVPPLLTPVKARGVAPEEPPEPKTAKSEIKIPPAPKLNPSIRIPTPEEVGLRAKPK